MEWLQTVKVRLQRYWSGWIPKNNQNWAKKWKNGKLWSNMFARNGTSPPKNRFFIHTQIKKLKMTKSWKFIKNRDKKLMKSWRKREKMSQASSEVSTFKKFNQIRNGWRKRVITTVSQNTQSPLKYQQIAQLIKRQHNSWTKNLKQK